MECQYRGCRKRAVFAIYKLNPDMTKKWIELCDECEHKVVKENAAIKRHYHEGR